MSLASELQKKVHQFTSNEGEDIEISWSLGYLTYNNYKSRSYRSIFINFLYNLRSREKESEKKSSLIYLIKIVSSKIIFSLQLSSLAWNQKSSYDWKSIEIFWIILGYARIDAIFSDLGIFSTFLYLTISIIWVYFVLLAILHLLSKTSKKIFLFILQLEKLWRNLIFSIGYIPMTYSMVTTIKYLLIYPNQEMPEYQDKMLDKNLMDFIIPFIITVILLFLFIYTHEIFIYEDRHSYSKYNWLSRSHSNAEKLKLIGINLIFITSMLCDSSNLVYIRVAICFVSFIITAGYVYYVPYYNSSINYLEASSTLFIGIGSFAYIISEEQNNPITGILLFIFLGPIFLWFLRIIMKHRYSHIKKHSLIKRYLDIYEFERAMRNDLFDKAAKQEVLETFDLSYCNEKLNVSRMIAIWEADYCLNVLHSPRLASIKIGAWYPWKKPNFSEEFLEYFLRKQLFEQLCKSCEDIQFLMCLEKLRDWKKTDKKFCINLINVVNLIYMQHYEIPSIFSSIKRLNERFCTLRKDYNEIVLSFPRNSEAHSLFYKNINDITNLMESEELTAHKSRYEGNMHAIEKSAEKLNYFEESSGIIIASGCKNNPGTILFANHHASKILRETVIGILDSNIDDYIPYPFSIEHKASVDKFLRSCKTADIEHSMEGILKRKNGLLVEITFTVKCASFDKYPLLLLLFREINNNRPICLLDDEGKIVGLNEHFPIMLYLSTESLLNKSIFDFKLQVGRSGFFRDLNARDISKSGIDNFRTGDFIRLCNPVSYILCQYSSTKISKKNMNLLAITHDEISQNAALNNLRAHLKDVAKKAELATTDDCPTFKTERTENCTNVAVINGASLSKKKLKLLTQSNNIHIPGVDSQQSKDDSVTPDQSSILPKLMKDDFWWDKYLTKIKKQFLIYKWVLLFSIITIVVTNAIILGFVLTELDKTKNISSLKETGLIIDTMLAISGHAVKMDISDYTNATALTVSQGIMRITSFIEQLKSMTKEMLNDLPSWNYCPSFSFYIDNEIPMWETDGDYKIVLKNLVDICQGYEHAAGDFLEKFVKNESYIKDYNYLVLNSIGIIAERSSSLMDILSSCETYRTNKLTMTISSLIAIAITVLFICACIITYIIIDICHTLQSFYSVIYKKIKHSYKDIQNKLINRLSDIHGFDYSNINNVQNTLPVKKWSQSDYIRMLLKISIYFVLTFAFYMIFYFYAYKKGEDYLLSRPDFIALFIKRQYFGRVLAFWARVYVFQNTPIGLYHRLNMTYFFANTSQEYFDLLDYYQKSLKLPLWEKKIQKFISPELREMIFESSNATSLYAKYGISSCQDEQFFQSTYIFEDKWNLAKFSSVLKTIDIIRDTLNTINYNIIDIATRHSTDLILQNFELLTQLTIIYAVFAAVIYIGFYLPSISHEFVRLETLKRFCKLI
ncbi:unnamed protein product [Blepharisma stoltei]|uniref:PAS domain-containing protein n=1 Tax=Blepharisma stoltei TaxID=1481888 RepID=A0AAU9IS18_9CILI|nr:unnamed protein product [Blepharisma stoltei]